MLPISLIEAIYNADDFVSLNAANKDDIQFVEEKENYIFTMDLPGFTKENIELDVRNNCLSIKAKKENDYSKDAKFYLKGVKSNERSVRYHLPKNTMLAQISAKLENGLLRVEFLKKAEVQPQQITIK